MIEVVDGGPSNWGNPITARGVLQCVRFYDYIPPPAPPDPAETTCDTVPNGNFTTPGDWLIAGTALAVSQGSDYYWGIGQESAVYQTLDLEPGTNYQATLVIHSITPADAEIPVRVSLGNDAVILTITGPGEYTANLSTPATAGPYEYRISNLSSAADLNAAGLNIDFTCLSPDGGSGGSGDCDTLDNPEFATADAWTLGGGATLTTDTLTLPREAYAEQQPDIEANTSYQAVVNVTNITAGPTTLRLSLGQSYKLLSVSAPGEYTVDLQALTGSETYRLMNEPPVMALDDPVVDIGFTCLTATGIDSGCIAPANGTFEDDSAWSWSSGGQWYANEQNALLPLDTEGITSQDVTLPVLPDVSGGNYWILSFDARGKYSDGVAYTSLTGPDFTDSLTITLGTAFQTYEIDASAYQESSVGLYFANFASEGSAADIFIDNVCVKWSDQPPADIPPPAGPPQVRPVQTITLTIDVECDDINQVLSEATGLDFVALESTTIPADWTDLGGWFYWLGSRLWVYVAKPIICALLYLWNLLAGILETIVNFLIETVVNPFLENIANPAVLWLYGIYAALLAFLADPFGKLYEIIKQIWDEYIYPTIEPWLEWLKQLWDEYIWPALQPYLQPVIDLWAWIQETLWPWLQELWDDPLGTIDDLLSSLLQLLVNLLLWIFQPIYDLMMWFKALLVLFLGPVWMMLEIIFWPMSFVLAVIVGIYGQLANPNPLPPLELGEYAVGYSLWADALAGTPLGTSFILVVNGIIWWIALRWALAELSSFNS